MIFVTVGTHTTGFDRLVQAIDAWSAGQQEDVVVQIGSSVGEPRHCRWFRFAQPQEIDRLMREARIVVTHAGAGSLLTAISVGRAVVAVPRRAAHGEALDDHQLELCEVLADAGLVRPAFEIEDLPAALAESGPARTASDASRRAMVVAVAATLDEWAAKVR